MAKLTILGSSFAIPDETHDNTHMVIQGEHATLMIDCGGNPLVRLGKAGVDFNAVTDLVLTHFHPDHVSGTPMLLMSMWLLGRQRPLTLYGLEHTLARIETLLGLYEWSHWPGMFPVAFCRLPEQPKTVVCDNEDFRVMASPVRHMLPTIGLRIEFKPSGKVLAYSCDTEPCDTLVELAEGADCLLHEASGAHAGHSSARQAGETAARAKVGCLYLIHYPTGGFDFRRLPDEARQAFDGAVGLAEDFQTLAF